MTEHRHEISDADASAVANPAAPLVIAVGGKAVVEHRSNGQPTYLTYRTHMRARMGLNRVLPHLPSAVIYERGPR